jgi:hypothetical protein
MFVKKKLLTWMAIFNLNAMPAHRGIEREAEVNAPGALAL